jgi:TolB protein
LSRLAVLGVEGAISLVDTRTGGMVGLSGDPEEDSRYLQPVWMPDGRHVVWSRATSPTDGQLEISGIDGSARRALAPGFPAFYLYPSPDGRRVAHLGEGPLGLELSVVDVENANAVLVTRGAPLFWSWAPHGDRLALHIGDELAVASPDGKVESLPVEAGAFLAPWSGGDGDSVIWVMRTGDREQLVVSGWSGDVRSVIAECDGLTRFVVDPSGRRLAYLHGQTDGPPALVMAEIATGLRIDVASEPVLGFWWSPDGTRLLMLGLAPSSQRPWLRWSVWSGGGDELRRYSPFLPSAAVVREVLPFFEQFAQSHRLWSPDSLGFTYCGVTASGHRGVWVQAVEGGEPSWVADGVSAWWSPV